MPRGDNQEVGVWKPNLTNTQQGKQSATDGVHSLSEVEIPAEVARAGRIEREDLETDAASNQGLVWSSHNPYAGSSCQLQRRRGPVHCVTFMRPHSSGASKKNSRKIVSVTLRLWKKGELWDPKKLTMQAT